jgi:hypothetical protein
VSGSGGKIAAFHLEYLPEHRLINRGELRRQGGDEQLRGSFILGQGPGGGRVWVSEGHDQARGGVYEMARGEIRRRG